MAVLLPAQAGNLAHEVVGEIAQDTPIFPAFGRHAHRLAELDRDPGTESRKPRLFRHDLCRADQTCGQPRTADLGGHPSSAGLAFVEASVGRPGSFWED